LADGGHTEVYLATAPDGAHVVIKVLNAELRAKERISDEQILWHFDNEIKAYEKVSHIGIINFIDHGEHYVASGKSFRYLILEYMPGGHLGTYCQRQRILTPEEVIRYFGPVCDALSLMHRNGVIHCDIKPTNLLMDAPESPITMKLGDMGVAKILIDGYAQDRALVGTPPYAAPEHNPEGDAGDLMQPVDARADVFALAMTIFYAMTGGKPKLNNGKLNDLPFHPSFQLYRDRLSDVLRTATAPRVDNRYASVEEFWNDFKDYKSVRPALHKGEEEIPTANNQYDQIVITLDRQVQLDNYEQATVIRLPEEISLNIVRIPAGRCLIGTDREEIEQLSNTCPDYLRDYARKWLRCEHPQHPVDISAFWMSTYPVTVKQWHVVATKLPQAMLYLEPKPCHGISDEQPVTKISWEQATEFCLRLSLYLQRVCQLPSESEWEYACRAGSSGMFNFPEDPNAERVSYCGVWPNEFEQINRAYARVPQVIGSVGRANAFGLYDMHGNVWEWCADSWRDGYAGAPEDGSPWRDLRDALRVIRGGSFRSFGISCRSASRSKFLCIEKSDDIGFRFVLKKL
jgi:formylglycine-generating enzyme required for sulfatase activity/tRNA A-37 threonylcarbamoyl transferase component Bud32